MQDLETFPFYLHWDIISCAKLRGKKPETMAKDINSIFLKAVRLAPSVIIMDDLDILTPADKTEVENMQADFLNFQ